MAGHPDQGSLPAAVTQAVLGAMEGCRKVEVRTNVPLGMEVVCNTSQMILLFADCGQSPNCPPLRKAERNEPSQCTVLLHPPLSQNRNQHQVPWAVCFAESTFTHPILAGAELLSSFIDEDTRAHRHPAFIYMVTMGDGWGEQGCCDYPQGHGVSVGGKLPESSNKESLLVTHPSAPSASQVSCRRPTGV